ncbi:Osmotically-inducible protein OsmY [Proteiniphilum saccharofermentans]|uniref:Osmotically-inducible protein OsmY n=1 Tax=Proteiniphilum saccharofermentans TaxID=1642647 RepID=A0A1R3SZ12_9BACT|nr:BON domain-containing protein [Proteiniphilum saccharofermentans]SCD20731.1 Osmotically-inducible protein OsmY [Proteiniphilum saccharofermentans]
MKALRLLSVVTLILALGVGVTSCNQVKDADIQSAAQELLDANPELAGVTVTVQNKVATLTGTVSDDAAKAYAESVVAGAQNVTSVVNQLEVVPPAPDYSELDAAINAALPDALKDHGTVTATVQDGVITLNGEIRESDLQVLIEKVNALSPVQVVNNLTVK